MNNPVSPSASAAPEDKHVKIIAPDYSLKKLVGEDIDVRQLLNPEKVEKAQSVINAHKENFLDWVRADLAALDASYAQIAQTLDHSEPEIKKLAKTAFVIKSQAGTFGYILATQIAKSLDDFCNRDFRPTSEHLTVIRKHIDALHVIFSKQITGDGGSVGSELANTLFKLVAKYQSNP